MIELFLFERLQSSGSWVAIDRVTTADQLAAFDGNDWRSLAVARDPIERPQESEKTELGIVIPAHDALAQRWLPKSPDFPIRVIGYRSEDYTLSFSTQVNVNSASVFLRAQVLAPTFSGSRCELRLRPPNATLEQVGPRMRYQRQCRWSLYGPGCTLSQASFEDSGNAIVSGDVSPLNHADYVFSTQFETASPVPGGSYAGGTLSFVSPETGDTISRQISEHVPSPATGDAYVKLVSRFPFEIAHNQGFSVAPGCAHTEQACKNSFSNIDNFGGFTSVSPKNPFTEGLS